MSPSLPFPALALPFPALRASALLFMGLVFGASGSGLA